MQYKIVISDRSFNVLDEIQDLASDISWGYGRIGGCAEFGFTIPSRFCRNLLIAPGYNVKIYRRNPSTLNYDLWYQGRIESSQPTIIGEVETLEVGGLGYQSELQDIYIDADYSSTEVSVIVKSLLDNYITPNTNITYDAGDIETTSFTPDSISFNGNASDAMRTLAEIVGSREWGVDSSRKFFFKARSASVGFRYPFGGKILRYQGDDSTRDIVNHVIIIGGGDPPFSATYDDAISQLKWGRRDKAYINSAITTTQVATQIASSFFTEFGDVVRRARVDILDEVQIESTIPIPLITFIPKLYRYGELKYGDFLYSGAINYQVNRVQYSLNNEGTLKLSIQAGQLRPSVAEDIGQLEFQIDQLRQQNI